ncbi:class I mannose-6-phosphate isomerase [Streptobacillus felis]|uniref:Phosphohexomutase n=1 Tax=Streptobacillus felis TaxID=1384509 RepID=A0A7Z0PGU4_9FUSO|nr:type I phosphomannose isomerase catalytic subunit [Streptobacillus felis]NYV28443.1 class I mannose-6-phosphate isomerase [Streptobacillus felis]
MKLYPLKFEKVLIPKVWGGRNLEKELSIPLPDSRDYGEAWEVSSHPNGMSIVGNGSLKGKTLQELFDEYKGELVGEEIYLNHPDRFPLLIKYLDVNDRLSIQVHPDDEVALKKHNELGKYESWYIMYASEDAKLIMGMKPGYNKESFLEKTRRNDFTNMFEEISVKAGDIIDVIPGTVHASLEGSVIFAEIQENSDITYRIYDFDRLENGKLRDLHLEDAADVIDFELKPKVVDTNFKDGEVRKNISNTPYYSIDRIKITEEFNDLDVNMSIYSILEGKGILEGEGELLEIRKGETVLVPANVSIKITGKLEVLRSLAK